MGWDEGWGGYCGWTPGGLCSVFRTGLQNEQRILSSRSPNAIGKKVLLIDPGLFSSTAPRGTRRVGEGGGEGGARGEEKRGGVRGRREEEGAHQYQQSWRAE